MATIDDYDIGQVLGRGGFAVVYRARRRTTGQEVALKISEKSKMIQLGMLDRVKNEIKIHHALKHPNVVRFYRCFEDKVNVYLVLELCTGGNMFRYLKDNGPLSEESAVAIIRQLIQGIEYIHSNGIIHRDLKLSNILIDNASPSISAASSGGTGSPAGNAGVSPNTGMDGAVLLGPVVKVCDFGLAVKVEHPDEEHYTLCGTPNYIAPEVASQQAHSYPADLWSIGCLFYSMVVGTPPFEQPGGVKDTLQKIITGAYEEPVDVISPDGLSFLRSLLQLVSYLTRWAITKYCFMVDTIHYCAVML